MNQDLLRIRNAVAALVRRERMVLLGRVGLRAVMLALVLLGVAATSAARGWDRPAAALVLVVLAGAGVWALVAVPLASRWRSSGSPRRQARLVEGLEPGLRGRLLTAVDRVEGPLGRESTELLALVARKAALLAERVPASRVHPLGSLAPLAVSALVAWMVALPLTLFVPGGPQGVAEFWFRGVADLVAERVSITHEAETARVGDLVLRYTYPSYTGLDPRVVSNSTGDVRGPPGTVVEVTARAAVPVEAAGLVCYDQRLDAAVSDDRREVRGTVTIQSTPGTYHLVLYRGGEPERSRDFAVEVEEDLGPEVMLDAEADEIEAALDQVVPMRWRARDDYGITKVTLSVNGETRSPDLHRAVERRGEVSDELELTPADLGLAPGDVADIVVVAWDNDSYSGPKPGHSRAIRLVVLGARGLAERDTARRRMLERVMVPVLARFLTEAHPPGPGARDLAAWGDVVLSRYGPIFDAVDDLWQGLIADSYDADVVRAVVESGRKLVRFVQVSFPTDDLGRAGDEALAVTAELRDEAIGDLEQALLAFLAMAEAEAVGLVAEAARDLQTASEQLREALASENPDTHELLARLDQLEGMLARLAESVAGLQDGGLKEFLNQRVSELQSVIEEIRDAIARGALDEARDLMERVARMLEELSQGIENDMQERVREGQEMGDRARALTKELEEIEAEQRRLREEVERLRASADEKEAGKVDALWEEVERLSAEVVDAGERYLEGIREARRRLYDVEAARAALEATESLHAAARARDLRGARSAAADGRGMWIGVGRAAAIRPAAPGEPGLPEVERITDRLLEIEALLERLDQQARQVDPGVQDRARELDGRQRDLENRLQQAQDDAGRLAEQFPVRPEGMKESLDQAEERMQEASEDLAGGRTMQAEGSQGVAADRVREAREAMDRAMRQSAAQQQRMQQGSRGRQDQGESQEDGGEQGSSRDPWQRMEIPGREEFQTPEEYRRALLEGMEAEVPEEYRALKKRYFEELVHQ